MMITRVRRTLNFILETYNGMKASAEHRAPLRYTPTNQTTNGIPTLTITTKIITNAQSFAGSHTTSWQKRLMGIEIYICCIEMFHGPQHKRGTYAVVHRRQRTQHRI